MLIARAWSRLPERQPRESAVGRAKRSGAHRVIAAGYTFFAAVGALRFAHPTAPLSAAGQIPRRDLACEPAQIDNQMSLPVVDSLSSVERGDRAPRPTCNLQPRWAPQL
jgi:hypothetical protein